MARKKRNISSKPTYVIVVDGETEVWYFQMLKRNEPNLKINIKPEIASKKRKKLSDQYYRVLELKETYTKVFWIIDLDVVIKESKEGGNNIQELKNYLNDLKEFKDVIIILNNPCLEFWFLLHFEKTTKYFIQCSRTEKQLKKHLPDYKKNRNYFTKQNNDIYIRLKDRLEQAIINSKRTQRGEVSEFEKGICEMNLFFEKLNDPNS